MACLEACSQLYQNTLQPFVKHINQQFKLSESSSSNLKCNYDLYTQAQLHMMLLLRTPDLLSSFRDGLGMRLVTFLMGLNMRVNALVTLHSSFILIGLTILNRAMRQ